MSEEAQVDELIPFDPNADCPKCGHGHIQTMYVKPEHCGSCAWVNRRPLEEYLVRICQCCRYQWWEAVKA